MEFPDARKDGFLAQEDVRRRAQELSIEAFVAAYPAPALLVAEVSVGGGGGDADATVKPGPQLLTTFRKGGNVFHYMDSLAFLVKRPGNPFPRFVSVGRASNNDLVVSVENISKFHAYFSCDGGRWSLTDYRSTNGTLLNGERLDPQAARPVADGDIVEFGDQIKLRFLLPESLYKTLRG